MMPLKDNTAKNYDQLEKTVTKLVDNATNQEAEIREINQKLRKHDLLDEIYADLRYDVDNNTSVTVTPEIPTTLSDKGGGSRNTIPRRPKMPEDIRKAMLKSLEKVFQTHKVCKYETISQSLRDFAVSASMNPKADSRMAIKVAIAVDSHKEELQEVISEVAVEIHGSLVSKSSPDDPQNDYLRGVVIDLLRGTVPGEKLLKADVFEAGRIELKREITINEYRKVMHDLCENKYSGWVLKKAQ